MARLFTCVSIKDIRKIESEGRIARCMAIPKCNQDNQYIEDLYIRVQRTVKDTKQNDITIQAISMIYHVLCFKDSLIFGYRRTPCAPEEISGIELLDDILKDKFIKMIWPNLLRNPVNRLQLSLNRCIDSLDLEELRIELEKRGQSQEILGAPWNVTDNHSWMKYKHDDKAKLQLQQRLIRYLESNECRKVCHLLIHGWVRKSKNLYIPNYLINIIIKYYPSVLYHSEI